MEKRLQPSVEEMYVNNQRLLKIGRKDYEVMLFSTQEGGANGSVLQGQMRIKAWNCRMLGNAPIV
jgi:hypothetical protein